MYQSRLVSLNWPFPRSPLSPVWQAGEVAEAKRGEAPAANPTAFRDPGEGLAASGEVTAARLQVVGLNTLADVRDAERNGQRWWVFAPNIGQARARRIARQVAEALGDPDFPDPAPVTPSPAKSARQLPSSRPATEALPAQWFGPISRID